MKSPPARDAVIIEPRALESLLVEAAAVATGAGLTDLRALAETRRQEACEDSLRVAFVGEFGSGKSQVINSLLGEACLPTAATPTTRLITEVEYGQQASVTLLTTDDLVQSVTLEDFAEMELPGDFRRARVTLPVEWLRELVLVDTPGLGEPEGVAGELLYEELPRADVIVFVFHAQAAFKRSERLFLAERILKSDRGKVVFLLNQIDHLQPEDVAELESYLRRQLAALVPRPTVLRYSALEALRGRLSRDPALLDRANFPEVERALVHDLAADHQRLHQANILAQLRGALEAGRAALEQRRMAARLTLAELDTRLAALEQERQRFEERLERVCERAGAHLDLIGRHLETQLQALRLRVEEHLPTLVGDADPRQLRKHMPFYLERLVKGYLEWQQPALEAELASLYQEIDRELSEAVAESLGRADLQPGYLASALRTRPPNYDRATQASRVLGVSGAIALLFAELPLAAVLLVASQALRAFGSAKREEAERQQMIQAGRRAMRACLDRAREELARQIRDYRAAVLAAIREEGEARMAGVIESLRQARADQEAAEADREGPGEALAGATADLNRLAERVARYEVALGAESTQGVPTRAPGGAHTDR